MYKNILFVLLFVLFHQVSGQTPAKPNAADILQSIKKLQVLGSVCFVAAHPDDENTRLISFLANERLYDITYLSLTRGDGGQNLIGPEIRELLGVIRTQELLAARRIDGGKQLFSRANDYGFSKKPSEAFRTWNRNEVLEDVVWAFRKLQPDVVINRFTADTAFENHGHHTASAILGIEAFDLAAKKDVFPKQFALGVAPWQSRRIFFNTSWWFYGSREKFDAADKSNLSSLDLGVYLPLKGKSNPEIAAESRSMHRCQGFGSTGSRGESIDYFDFIKGDKPNTKDPFEGINTSWSRLEGGEKIGKLLLQIEKNYKSDDPEASVSDLIRAMISIQKLPESFWKIRKLVAIQEVIKNCAGLFIEAVAADFSATPGDKIKVKLEVINRSNAPIALSSIRLLPTGKDTSLNLQLTKNKGFFIEKQFEIDQNAAPTSSYWLAEPFNIGMYQVAEPTLRGIPETPRYGKIEWQFLFRGNDLIKFTTDIIFKKEIPERGEIYQPFEILPPVFVEITEPVYIFSEKDKLGRPVTVKISAGKAAISGNVRLKLPEGWTSEPAFLMFDLKKKNESKSLIFNVLAPENASDGQVLAIAEMNGTTFSQKLVAINYEHIPTQNVLLEASARVVKLAIQTNARRLGYYMGAGDEVPQSLRQIGCEVTLLNSGDLNLENLRRFDAIVVGVRAYNAKDAIVFDHEKLLEYARVGGTLVVQYNTTSDLSIKELAPFKLKIGRERVTLEDAPVRFLKPESVVLNTPNKITQRDFDNWFQERGLYFPSEWGAEFEAPLSMNDPGEKPKDGALLIAKYGEGYYIYTGLSFFRELPAGVPGAYRLFANLISLGHENPKP
jgi:LmbE family N-acetylglucosaminyl deacetylase